MRAFERQPLGSGENPTGYMVATVFFAAVFTSCQIARALFEPGRVTRRVALPCACQQRGAANYAQEKQETAVSQNRSAAAGFGSHKGRCP
jgi:hypothetical protein